MAPFVPVKNVVKISFMVTSATYAGGWRQFFSYSSAPPAAADCNGLASGAADAWANNLAAVTSSALALTSVTVADLNSDIGNVGQWSGTHQGALATTFAVPADTAVLVNHQIPRHYRGGKPRTYLPSGSAQELQSSKLWSDAYVGQVQAAWGSFVNGIIAAGLALGVLTHVSVSYKSGHIENPKAGVWDPANIPAPRPDGPLVSGIVAHRVSPIPGSQRRRLRKT